MSCDAGGWLKHGCEGSWQRCGLCNQNVCFYHGHSNNDGVKGGHDGCRGKCNTSFAFRVNCEGHMKKCQICNDWYCHYHATGVAGGTLTGGHVCDVRSQEPRQAVTESALALAEISSVVYYVDSPDEHRADFDKVKRQYGYALINASIRTQGTVHMAVFESGNKKVLAFKGTSLGNGHDIEQDLRMIIGGDASRNGVTNGLNIARQLVREYGVNLITGHSLGGYFAEILATNDRICGISFCNPGVNGPNVKLGGVVVRGFQNINFEHDPAGNLYVGTYQHVQWSVYVSGVSHGIGGMIDYFKNHPNVDNMNVISRCESHPTGYYYPK